MQPGEAGFDQLKQRMRATWIAGDFGQIARFSSKAAEEFVTRMAIPAGVDIAPNLLAQGRERAARENLDVRFDEGDAEQLPYPDAGFDFVITMFGAMFAPRPERVAAEMFRVCRPGGTIAMGNWTPTGFAAKMFGTSARYTPPPEGVPPPVLWGDEATVKERLRGGASKITTTLRKIDFEFALPPEDVVKFFRAYFGPVHMAFARLNADQQAAYAADLETLWRGQNQSKSGGTSVPADYLEVIAIRA
jgi:SAM-dependent methyltransferase